MEGEALPLPTFEERERTILDGARIDRLLQEAVVGHRRIRR